MLIFVGTTFRKVKIIEELAQKASEYEDIVNIYEKVENVTQGIVTEYFNNGDREKLVLTRVEDGETTKIEYYNNGKRINSFTTTSDGNMVAKYDIGIPIEKPHIIGMLFDNKTDTDKLKIALTHSIKTVKLDDKECYYFQAMLPRDFYINMHCYELNDLYIEKATGLELQMSDGILGKVGKPIILKYSYDFGNVKVEEFTEPEDVVIEVIEDTITTTGADIIIKSNNPLRKYGWDEVYYLEVKKSNVWTEVERVNETTIISSISKFLDDENQLKDSIYWSNRYGELEEGTYRISKSCDGIRFFSEEFTIDENTTKGEIKEALDDAIAEESIIMKYDRETGERTEVDMSEFTESSSTSTEATTLRLKEKYNMNF